MAVTKVPESSRLLIAVQTGVNADGKAVIKNRIFRNVKPKAADSDVYAVGEALAGLQAHSLAGLSRGDEGRLISNP